MEPFETRLFRPVVIVPTYNNCATLPQVLDRIARLSLPLLVINDGSTDGTSEFLAQWRQAHPQHAVFSHPLNRGKAAALQTGFAHAVQLGFTHAVTIDSDGQLAPEEIPDLLRAAQLHPESLVLGVRDDHAPGYPTKSRVGRSVSNFMIHLESGTKVTDSQCGLRVYPLDLIRFLNCRAARYAFETEVLTRAAWAGCDLIEVPVSCDYFNDGARVSHFRPWLDSWRSVAMHLPLIIRALTPWPHKSFKPTPPQKRAPASQFWKRLIDSLNPAVAYRALRQDQEAGPAIAVALGLGVWIANLPLYGIQTLAGIYAARRLHLNALAIVLGTQISAPPMGPVLIATAIAIGHLLLHGSLPVTHNFDVHALGWGRVLGPILLDWLLGGAIQGFLLGIVTFFLSLPLLQRMRVSQATPPDEVFQPLKGGAEITS